MADIFSDTTGQKHITNRLPVPVDVVADTTYVQSITGEAMALYYFNSGVPTADAGQAAGTVVVFQLAYSGICDRMGSMIGNDKETSLTWTTDTVLPIASIQPFPATHAEDPTNATLSQIAADITANYTNGQWCLDHRTGIGYGKKATTGTGDTAAYKVRTATTGGSTTVTESVNIMKVGSDAVAAANTARTTATKVLPTQNIGADGTVSPTGSLLTNAPFTKLTDGTSNLTLGTGTTKTVPSEIHDGTTGVDVIATINSLKSDVSSVGGEAIIADDSAMAATPKFVPVGGEYRATNTTYTDGDATVLQTDKYGQVKVSGSSGVSGGGLSLYVLDSLNSLGHGTTAYTAATQFTIAGYAFSVNPRLIAKIERFSSAGAYQETITPLTHTITEASGVFTVTGMSASAGDLFVLYIQGAERTNDVTLDAQKTVTQNPLNQQIVEESIADTTNVADNTYYPASTGMSLDGYKDFSLNGQLIDGAGETTSLTVETTNDEDTTNGRWVRAYGVLTTDIGGTLLLDTAAAIVSATNQTTDYSWEFDNINARYIRLKIDATAATNTVIIKSRKRY